MTTLVARYFKVLLEDQAQVWGKVCDFGDIFWFHRQDHVPTGAIPSTAPEVLGIT